MIWITGKNGALAQALQKELENKKLDYIASDRDTCNLQYFHEIENFYHEYHPSYIFHCAAFTDVDLANVEQQEALADNFLSVQYLTRVANPHYTKIVFFSSDYLFDGRSSIPYTESEATNPLQFYGKTKKLAEEALQKGYDNHLIIRLSWLYSHQKGFPFSIIQQATQDTLSIVQDEVGAPTFIPKIIDPIFRLAWSSNTGMYHLASEGSVNRYQLALSTLKLAKQANIISHIPHMKAITAKEYRLTNPLTALRPAFSALDSHKAKTALKIPSLGTWQEHLEAFIASYPK